MLRLESNHDTLPPFESGAQGWGGFSANALVTVWSRNWFFLFHLGKGFDRRYSESGWRMAETSVVLNPVGQLEKNLKHSKSVEVLEATLC